MAFPKQYTLLSNNNSTQQSSVFVGLVIYGILDASKLENAHKELVRLWPALGGQLVTSTRPYSFTSGDIVNFKSRFLSQKLSDVPLVAFTETSATVPTLHHIPNGSDHLFHFDAMDKFPPPDTLFALRVTVLLDATLLGFRFSHHLCDGQACFDTINAFCDIVNGRPIPKLIPPPDIHSFLSEQVEGEDHLPPGVHPDPVRPEDSVTVGLQGVVMYLAILILRMVMVRLGLREGDEERLIHLPGSFVAWLREECQYEIDAASEDGKGLQTSRNDVITAWLLKSSYSKFKPNSKTGIDILTSFNYRPYLTPLPQNTTYLHNSFYTIRTPFSTLSQFNSLSLSQIALEVRRTCIMNKQPSAVKATVQFREQVKGPSAPHPHDRSMAFWEEHEIPMSSHWTRFEYNLLDFSGAFDERCGIEVDLGKREGGREGKVVYTQPLVLLPFGLTTRPFAVIMKDGRGGYWVRVRLSVTGWRGVEDGVRTYLLS
ncbi:hypothetical protein BDQ17DRAFT_1313625 [Cyathus striatus]|nr:hypothetical protein BDQ17DRAFT_1313625 [Cyathus striatus]